MSRKNRTPEENARRAKIRELLQEANITSMADIQSLFKETIAEFMENGLEAAQFEQICVLQGFEGAHGRSQSCLCRGG